MNKKLKIEIIDKIVVKVNRSGMRSVKLVPIRLVKVDHHNSSRQEKRRCVSSSKYSK